MLLPGSRLRAVALLVAGAEALHQARYHLFGPAEAGGAMLDGHARARSPGPRRARVPAASGARAGPGAGGSPWPWPAGIVGVGHRNATGDLLQPGDDRGRRRTRSRRSWACAGSRLVGRAGACGFDRRSRGTPPARLGRRARAGRDPAPATAHGGCDAAAACPTVALGRGSAQRGRPPPRRPGAAHLRVSALAERPNRSARCSLTSRR
jgi:hypothetical protein